MGLTHLTVICMHISKVCTTSFNLDEEKPPDLRSFGRRHYALTQRALIPHQFFSSTKHFIYKFICS